MIYEHELNFTNKDFFAGVKVPLRTMGIVTRNNNYL